MKVAGGKTGTKRKRIKNESQTNQQLFLRVSDSFTFCSIKKLPDSRKNLGVLNHNYFLSTLYTSQTNFTIVSKGNPE